LILVWDLFNNFYWVYVYEIFQHLVETYTLEYTQKNHKFISILSASNLPPKCKKKNGNNTLCWIRSIGMYSIVDYYVSSYMSITMKFSTHWVDIYTRWHKKFHKFICLLSASLWPPKRKLNNQMETVYYVEFLSLACTRLVIIM
jgi:hypothetical protein